MNVYLRRERHWLGLERLLGCAPDRNPVETLWGNIKGQELANRCADRDLNQEFVASEKERPRGLRVYQGRLSQKVVLPKPTKPQ